MTDDTDHTPPADDIEVTGNEDIVNRTAETDETTIENDTRALEAQLHEAFGEVIYPVESPADLTTAFRSWDNTTFGDDVDSSDLTSARLQVHLPDDPAAYPYESPAVLVTALLDHLEAAGVVTHNEDDDRYEVG